MLINYWWSKFRTVFSYIHISCLRASLGKPRFPLKRWALGSGYSFRDSCPHWTPMMNSIYLTWVKTTEIPIWCARTMYLPHSIWQIGLDCHSQKRHSLDCLCPFPQHCCLSISREYLKACIVTISKYFHSKYALCVPFVGMVGQGRAGHGR